MIKKLNSEIKSFFQEKKKSRVRRNIIPGNNASLRTAVKIANDVNTSDLPNILYENNVPINDEELPDRIANYFSKKIADLSEEATIWDDFYNGTPKILAQPSIFMDSASVKECMMSLKVKNSEGYDRIPQRCLVDGVELLCIPFSGLLKGSMNNLPSHSNGVCQRLSQYTTRQVYNLFQDLWNRFIILVGG